MRGNLYRWHKETCELARELGMLGNKSDVVERANTSPKIKAVVTTDGEEEREQNGSADEKSVAEIANQNPALMTSTTSPQSSLSSTTTSASSVSSTATSHSRRSAGCLKILPQAKSDEAHYQIGLAKVHEYQDLQAMPSTSAKESSFEPLLSPLPGSASGGAATSPTSTTAPSGGSTTAPSPASNANYSLPELQQLHPFLDLENSQNIVLHYPDAGRVDARAFGTAMVREINRLGNKNVKISPTGSGEEEQHISREERNLIFENCTVVETNQRKSDFKWEVTVEWQNGGTVREQVVVCDHVVNAAGLNAREVGMLANVEVPVAVMQHQYLMMDEIKTAVASQSKTSSSPPPPPVADETEPKIISATSTDTTAGTADSAVVPAPAATSSRETLTSSSHTASMAATSKDEDVTRKMIRDEQNEGAAAGARDGDVNQKTTNGAAVRHPESSSSETSGTTTSAGSSSSTGFRDEENPVLEKEELELLSTNTDEAPTTSTSPTPQDDPLVVPIVQDIGGSFSLYQVDEQFSSSHSFILAPAERDVVFSTPASATNCFNYPQYYRYDANIDRLFPHMEAASKLMPLLGGVGIKEVVNAPIVHALDALPLVGPVAIQQPRSIGGTSVLSSGGAFGITSAASAGLETDSSGTSGAGGSSGSPNSSYATASSGIFPGSADIAKACFSSSSSTSTTAANTSNTNFAPARRSAWRKNYWLATANGSLSVARCAGLGNYLAHFILHNEPPYELDEVDPRRFANSLSPEKIQEGVRFWYSTVEQSQQTASKLLSAVGGDVSGAQDSNSNTSGSFSTGANSSKNTCTAISRSFCNDATVANQELLQFLVQKRNAVLDASGQFVESFSGSGAAPATGAGALVQKAVSIFRKRGSTAEAVAVRKGVALAYLPRAAFEVKGVCAEQFLDRMLTCRIPVVKMNEDNVDHFEGIEDSNSRKPRRAPNTTTNIGRDHNGENEHHTEKGSRPTSPAVQITNNTVEHGYLLSPTTGGILSEFQVMHVDSATSTVVAASTGGGGGSTNSDYQNVQTSNTFYLTSPIERFGQDYSALVEQAFVMQEEAEGASTSDCAPAPPPSVSVATFSVLLVTGREARPALAKHIRDLFADEAAGPQWEENSYRFITINNSLCRVVRLPPENNAYGSEEAFEFHVNSKEVLGLYQYLLASIPELQEIGQNTLEELRLESAKARIGAELTRDYSAIEAGVFSESEVNDLDGELYSILAGKPPDFCGRDALLREVNSNSKDKRKTAKEGPHSKKTTRESRRQPTSTSPQDEDKNRQADERLETTKEPSSMRLVLLEVLIGEEEVGASENDASSVLSDGQRGTSTTDSGDAGSGARISGEIGKDDTVAEDLTSTRTSTTSTATPSPVTALASLSSTFSSSRSEVADAEQLSHCVGGEPIWVKTSYFDDVAGPHGRDRDDNRNSTSSECEERIIGYTTSGAFSNVTGKSMAMGYVEKRFAKDIHTSKNRLSVTLLANDDDHTTTQVPVVIRTKSFIQEYREQQEAERLAREKAAQDEQEESFSQDASEVVGSKK
ncbi:unnamed protein product [Amoebophrya sp. A120]|nr:unnamed protein product [Amoebophrya sp. A120]|eukprot:GSA120T00019900001.1